MNPFPVSHWGGEAAFAATPSFYAPLTNSLVPTIAGGSATPSFNRTSGANTTDWEGVVRGTASAEARFIGARRVATIVSTKSEDWTNASWSKTNMTPAATTLTAAAANATVLQTNSNGAQPVVLRVRMSRITGTGNIQLTLDGSTYTTVTLTGSPQVFSISQTTAGNPTFGIRIVTSGDSINADQIMVENTLAQSNTNPSEYVSIGVLSSPYHGAIVDGVKYFATKNGNTVSSNVVSEVTGAALTPANGASSGYTDSNGPYGLLMEEARTNIITRSEEFQNVGGNNAWNVSQATVTVDQTASPAGSVGADWLREDNTNNEHQDYWPYTGATAAAYTLSIYAKQKERTWLFLSFTASASVGAFFDLANGVIGNIDTGYTATIKPAANGFYRCAITVTATAATWYAKIVVASANGTKSYTGTTGSGIYVWGVQLELGAYATSYRATVGSTSTRSADSLSYSFASNAGPTVGTAYAEVNSLWSAANANNIAIGFTTATTGPLYCAAADASTTIKVNDGTNTVQKTGLSDMRTAVRKYASSWTGSTLLVTGSGAAVASGTFDGNMGSTGIGIGDTTSGAGQWNGTIRNVRIYTVAATAAELATLTA